MKATFISLAKIGRNLAIILGVLLIIALLGMIRFPWEQSFRVVFGVFYVLFIPGYIWSYVFFKPQETTEVKKGEVASDSHQEKKIDGIERIVLSLALSIALSPLALFFLNKVGVKINFWNSFLVIMSLIIIGLGIIVYQQLSSKRRD